jgi:hypothetical protein
MAMTSLFSAGFGVVILVKQVLGAVSLALHYQVNQDVYRAMVR